MIAANINLTKDQLKEIIKNHLKHLGIVKQITFVGHFGSVSVDIELPENNGRMADRCYDDLGPQK